MVELNDAIKNALGNNTLIIFVGSGLSINLGLPNWETLVCDVIDQVENDTYRNVTPLIKGGILSPLQGLDIIEKEYKKEIYNYVEKRFTVDESSNLELHKKLFDISGRIITTNFDNALELSAKDAYVVVDSSFKISNIKEYKKCIFKIHGCSKTDASKCIIFSEDYKKHYEKENATILKLKDLFINNTILFIGFGFKDPFVNELFGYLDKLFESNNIHYALTDSENNAPKLDYIKTINIGSFDAIGEFLDKCIAYKMSQNNTVVIKTDYSRPTNKKLKIAILYPNPIDIELNIDLSSIINCFSNYEVIIEYGYLNKRTLFEIDDHDILFIITKCFKDKLYIEEDNIKSQLVTVSEICNYIFSDETIKVFITDVKIADNSRNDIISIASHKRDLLRNFIYKFLLKNDFTSNNDFIQVGRIAERNFCLNKGKSISGPIYKNQKVLEFVTTKILNTVVGRKEEQTNIAAGLLNIIASNKILNIKGSGGIGKTTLIKKVAYELYLRGNFSDGITFNSCENVKSYNDFEETITQGFNLYDIVDLKDHLLKTGIKQNTLIILDNFETVSNIENKFDYKRILDLLEFVSDYANIVITSRESLNVDFEDLISINPMSTDGALELFLKHYGQIKDPNEIQVLRRDILENLLDNNPLAIKLVTSNSPKYKTLIELKEQLEDQFFEMTSEEFTTIYKRPADINIQRTKSLYQSINYSYSKLSNKEKLAFELLHLFPDGIDISHFKKWFNKNKSDGSTSDHHLRCLVDKSLVENNEGILRLQPIIRRFASHEFERRSLEKKQQYYLDAYSYNCFIIDIVKFIHIKKSYSSALKLFNNFKENVLCIIDHIKDIPLLENGVVPEKKYLLNFLYLVDDFFINKRIVNKFETKLESLKNYFSDLPKAEILIETIVLRSIYYNYKFDEAYEKMGSIFSAQEMANAIIPKDDYIGRRYTNLIAIIHSMEGYTLDYCKFWYNNNSTSIQINDWFYLGLHQAIDWLDNGFYRFETKLTANTLDVSELKDYIDSLYIDEHLEKIQCLYVLSKVENMQLDEINELIVTNPYTRGLKELMFAFNKESKEDKKKHFGNAISHLSHIKYYYLEAIYFYCKFLKEIGDPEFDSHFNLGMNQSKKYYYQFLDFRFQNLKSEINPPYICNYDYYPEENIKEIVKKYNSVLNEYMKDNADLVRND